MKRFIALSALLMATSVYSSETAEEVQKEITILPYFGSEDLPEDEIVDLEDDLVIEDETVVESKEGVLQ